MLAVTVGIIAGLSAALLESAIDFGTDELVGRFTYLSEAKVFHFDWRILILPCLGCLVAGIFAYRVYPGSREHGVDLMTRAFHRHMGEMSLPGPVTKAAGAAIVISSGGSAGPEGPIAALGAAIGSFVGRIFPLTAHERRILMVAGCAAGVGAIFQSPLGGALFATSVLYSEPEFESDAIVPSFVASVLGYSTFMFVRDLMTGEFVAPLIKGVVEPGGSRFESPTDLFWYAVLGPLCGLVAILFYFCLRLVEHGIVDRFKRVPRWVWPAFGGLATGAIACFLPQVMDSRFEFLQNAVGGRFSETASIIFSPWGWVAFFGIVVVMKCVATGLTIGSGAPGGVLGPSVFIGGVLGAFLGALGMALFPGSIDDDLRRALIPVGMAGVLAATMRTPLAAIVMTTEMTGSFGLIAPLMLVCVTSYIIGRRWGLNHEQVRTAADSPTHAADPIIHLLETWRVRDLVDPAWSMTVSPDTPLDEVIERIQPGVRPVVAVADNGELKGVISASDIGTVMSENPASGLLIASEVMTTRLITLDADDDIYGALTTFDRVDHDTLPVMARQHGKKHWVGMLTRKRIVEELHRELEISHEVAFVEHPSLRAIRENVQIDQLVMGVPSKHADIQRLFVPIDAIGRSLRECDFRRRYQAQVIAIEQRDGSIQCPPDLDAPLSTDQRLLAVLWQSKSSEDRARQAASSSVGLNS